MNYDIHQVMTNESGLADDPARADSRVIVSLSSIPARFQSLPKCVASILRQTRAPELIVLNIPRYYKRFKIGVRDDELPLFDDPRVIINRCEDYGPGTKLLGAASLLEKGDLVVLVDDDHGYGVGFLEDLIRCANSGKCAASFHVYEVQVESKHIIGQGADGFAIPVASLDGIESYFKVIQNNQHLFLNDDIWISFFLEMKGVNILNCHDFRGNNGMREEKIMESELLTDAEGLMNIKGRYSRWRSVYRGIRYLERKRPWLEASVGLRESPPKFSPKVCFADFIDWIRR